MTDDDAPKRPKPMTEFRSEPTGPKVDANWPGEAPSYVDQLEAKCERLEEECDDYARQITDLTSIVESLDQDLKIFREAGNHERFFRVLMKGKAVWKERVRALERDNAKLRQQVAAGVEVADRFSRQSRRDMGTIAGLMIKVEKYTALTKDGVRVGPGDEVWWRNGHSMAVVEWNEGPFVFDEDDDSGVRDIYDCYSTRAAAEAAAKEGA